MMIWWCEEHNCQSTDGTSKGCFIADYGAWQECRITEKQLVSVETLEDGAIADV